MGLGMFDIIKKQNGEKFAKTLRTYNLLEIPNIDKIVRYAGNDAGPILKYLLSLKKFKIQEQTIVGNPFELLKRAGYDAEYADTLEKQNSIEKYFIPDERLCTFDDKTRYQKYYIINAVKSDAGLLKRSDFIEPMREDKYGTSVISIQILKSGGFISIKNRYNHSVQNPDNTFDSNPDKIIPGLACSLKKFFDVEFFENDASLPEGFIIMNGQVLKYNYEINNAYYGANFVAQDGIIKPVNKDSEIILDYFVFNTQTKQLSTNSRYDAFLDAFYTEIKDSVIQIKKNKRQNTHTIFADKNPIAEVKEGKIIKLNLVRTRNLGDNFLRHNSGLVKLSANNLRSVGNNFLCDNKILAELNLQNLQEAGNSFLENNLALEKLQLQNLQTVEANFLLANQIVNEVNFENLLFSGDFFLHNNLKLKKLSCPRLLKTKSNFLTKNKIIKDFFAPLLKQTGNKFLPENTELRYLSLPSLVKTDGDFLSANAELKYLCARKLEIIGKNFLTNNKKLKKLSLPNAVSIEDCFLQTNLHLSELYVPRLKSVGNWFLRCNMAMQKLYLPALIVIGDDFFAKNENIYEISAPFLQRIGNKFLAYNNKIERISLPRLQHVKDDCLHKNTNLSYLYAPKLESVAKRFLYRNTRLQKMFSPLLQTVGKDFMHDNQIFNKQPISNFSFGQQVKER